MLREGLRLSRRHQRWLYGSTAVLFVSGAAWLLFRHFVRIQGEFGETAHPLEPWWLKLHGAAAMALIGVLGSLVRGHIRVGWHVGMNRPSGAVFLAANAFLVASGWGLYYVGTDQLRSWISQGHWVVGLALPPLAVLHVWRGRTARRRAMSAAAVREPFDGH
jgi:hypothetical protein